ncbi:hypothetical protein Lepto7376_3148 [[Leptolyngbya] sp. PCC 7376]|uniref:hypothetical protein n=1 Tax=[Leptolyngbya] sp. PCC 7376 TaxID=111781 RepID=UPI00029EF6ED|nr:hypothetical protein [[Leptolyngbya] sp. PCC 7376]AFY39382.1 hypothetical protein Lepto7376_3148 [[Leptolyngbya] sp. PCC 7376]
MLTRKTFFLSLAALSLGNALFLIRPATADFSTQPKQLDTEKAIASSPFNPKDKGEPDNTLSGATRSWI